MKLRPLRLSALIAISIIAAALPIQNNWAGNRPIETTELFWNKMKKVAQVTDLEERKRVMAVLFNEHFAFERFYERALIDHWSGWNPDQKAEFGSKFRTRFVSQASDEFSRILGKLDRTLKHKAERTSWGYRVRSSTETKKGTLTVSTYLARVGDRWKIIDLDIEGALLSRNYRGQFNRILRKYGYHELIRRIEQG